MIRELRPHTEHQQSAIPWLPTLPAHWGTRRLGHACEIRVSNVDKHIRKGETTIRLCNYVDVYKNEQIRDSIKFKPGTVTEDERIRFQLKKFDVVITKDSEEWNDIGIPSLIDFDANDLVCGYHLAVLRPRHSMNGAFLLRVLQCQTIASQLHIEANGVTRYGLSKGAIKSVVVPLPPLSNQMSIVLFLNHATAKIDRAIRTKKKLIALLNEQKQSIIHQAVTHGLDPSVKFKPSSIPWLDRIPRHWNAVRNLALFSHKVQQGMPGLPVLQVSLRSGVTIEDLNQSGRPKRLIANPTKYKLAHNGDLAYNTMRMWQGAVGVVPINGLVSPAYVVIQPREGVNAGFYELVFRTAAYKQQVNRYSTGIVSDRNRLYWENFKQMPNVSLPWEEQVHICKAIEERSGDLSVTVSRLQREIDLLREYRTRLTADVVTGKIDVRDVAKHLPNEVQTAAEVREEMASSDENEEGDEEEIE